MINHDLIIKFINEAIVSCMTSGSWYTINTHVKKDIEAWYNADKNVIEKIFDDKTIPWAVVDIVIMNIRRYMKNEPELDDIIRYVYVLKSKYNN